MRGVVAALCRLHPHQLSQERVDRTVCAAWAPGVRPVYQSVAAARVAKAGYPVMNTLARHLQRLRHLVDGLATGAFQYSKAPAVLAHIVGMLQRFLQLALLCGSQLYPIHGKFLLPIPITSV
jgi:hypothetical protein